MTSNVFTYNVAKEGGALYMINPTASPLFDAITCTSNVATHNGGCIYIGETSASKTFSFDNPSGASTWNKNEANLGGVVYVDSN